MTQDEFISLVGQFYKEGLVLLIVEEDSVNWLNTTTLQSAVTDAITPSMCTMARVIRDTAIKGQKIALIAQRSVGGYSKLEMEADVVATVGFDINRIGKAPQLIITKWRGLEAIPSPGVWPLTK
ncbi:hypothetical protein pEaSNUABM29_00224 [Erwinia phage pEa_SNUABM_29]|nr:hypothetical protein pEaSNUABM29_00224 [Erwinia phage pEa_SNUABM_29]